MKYLEDFAPGDVFTFQTPGASAEEVIAFGETWDPQRLHTDPEYAKTVHGDLIASGFQTLLYVFRPLMSELMPGVANIGGLGLDNLRWERPWHPDTPLKVTMEVLDVTTSRSKPDRGIMSYRVTGRDHDGHVVLVTDANVMMSRRSGSPSE